jgi:hypothetical protein
MELRHRDSVIAFSRVHGVTLSYAQLRTPKQGGVIWRRNLAIWHPNDFKQLADCPIAPYYAVCSYPMITNGPLVAH